MIPERAAIHSAPSPTSPAVDSGVKLKFGSDGGFQRELRKRVEEFFQRSGRRERDCPQMYFKSAVILATLIVSYVVLVFVASTWWQALPAALMLGAAIGCIGFNIMHDGGHMAYSNHAWVNRVSAMSLDLVGASSHIWRWKHAVFHHMYVNVQGYDSDTDLGAMARLNPHQPRLWVQRFQHWYIWLLYGVMVIRWQFYGDFRDLAAGHIGEQPFRRPRGWDLAQLIGFKLLFVVLAFGIPLLFHSFAVVALVYVGTLAIVGIALSLVFQLAHCVEEAEFPLPNAESGRIDNAWAIHQIESTVNFARDNRVLCWLLGGLNFQIEHHLFPRICHVNYPALSRVVEQTCRDFGVRYREHRSFLTGIASHYRWMRQMGRPTAA
jgi:linoleoyl-CoA desaturase